MSSSNCLCWSMPMHSRPVSVPKKLNLSLTSCVELQKSKNVPMKSAPTPPKTCNLLPTHTQESSTDPKLFVLYAYSDASNWDTDAILLEEARAKNISKVKLSYLQFLTFIAISLNFQSILTIGKSYNSYQNAISNI